MQHRVRIVVADDHPIFRAGIRALLSVEPQIEIVGEADDGPRTIGLVRECRPDLLLLDVNMPGMSGLEVLQAIARQNHPPRVLLLTASIETQQIVAAFRMGAGGVLLKDSAAESLLAGLRSVVKGRYWLGRIGYPDAASAIRSLGTNPGTGSPATANYGLTPRELQIVAYVTSGMTNKQIAEDLKISDVTVRHHLTSVFDKLGVSNRLELVLFAIERALVVKSSSVH